MLRFLIYTFFFFFFTNHLLAQYLHDPAEIIRIMDKSKIQYVLDTLPLELEKKEYPLVEETWLAIETPEGIVLEQQDTSLSSQAKKNYAKGMKAYEKANYEKAISFCKKALADHPTNLELMKRIGRSYDAWNNNETAKYWYQQAIDFSFIDFEAHYLIAHLYQLDENQDKAIYHISLAHLLNRNHKGILKALKEIYAHFGIEFKEWTLEPIYTISKKENNQIRISAEAIPWRAYANCKAVWQFESAYSDKMKSLSKATVSLIEEKECLLNALIAYEKLKTEKDKYPELKCLSEVLIQRKVDDYILYEVSALSNPTALILLPKEKLEHLISYLLSYHVKNYEN